MCNNVCGSCCRIKFVHKLVLDIRLIIYYNETVKDAMWAGKFTIHNYLGAIDTRGRGFSKSALLFTNDTESFVKTKEWTVTLF